MATSAVAGYKGLLKLSTAAAGSKTAVAELRNFSIKADRPEIDATSHESSGFREVIAGTFSWTGSADYLTVITNATQKAAFDLLSAGTKIDGEFIPTGSTGDGSWSGSLYITSWDFGSPLGDATASNIAFTGTAALTRNSSA